MVVYKMERTDEDKHSIWPYLVATLTLAICGSILTILMSYHFKKISARMSLRLAKNSGKTMKTPVYKAVAVHSQDRDAVILKDVSSRQELEENLMIPESMKKQKVLKKDARSAIPV